MIALHPPDHPDPHVLQWQLALSALPLSIAITFVPAALQDLLAHCSPWSHLPALVPNCSGGGGSQQLCSPRSRQGVQRALVLLQPARIHPVASQIIKLRTFGDFR